MATRRSRLATAETEPAQDTMTTRTRAVVVGVVGFVLAIVVMNLVARGLDSAVGGSEPGGASGSSYSTGPDGLAAYAQLLSDYGHPVLRLRGSLADATIDPRSTLFVTASDRGFPLEPEEIATIRAMLDGGGRVVLAGLREGEVAAITGTTLTVTEGTVDYRDFAAALDELRTVRTAAIAAYDTSSEGALDVDVLASEGDRALLVSARVATGVALVLADASPIENAMIGEEDNAAFGLALPGGGEADGNGGGEADGTANATVVFAEGVHGYGERSGLTALPDRWKIALFVLGAAAVLFAWSRARRLGPPDRLGRDLPPARATYLAALGSTLERTGEPTRALAPLGDLVRDRILARAGLPVDASAEALTVAARQLGFSDDEIATLREAPVDDQRVLALGRVAAKLPRQGFGEGTGT